MHLISIEDSIRSADMCRSVRCAFAARLICCCSVSCDMHFVCSQNVEFLKAAIPFQFHSVLIGETPLKWLPGVTDQTKHIGVLDRK